MPRYYFHVLDGGLHRDVDGTDLLDVDTARQEALRFAGVLMSESALRDELGINWGIQVDDATAKTVFRLNITASF